ncbi:MULTISPECIES: helix-turn-helix domain-containing protein [Burkholderia]|uniref:helix-turn-helix domain-containing protein n=1 Tax=Burkholderia TaxID=32008 RepID=UPI002203746F|nr:DNA-binding protein [Burkholderia glumae]
MRPGPTLTGGLFAARQRLQTLRDAQAQGLLTPADAARDVGISRQAVSQLVNRGRLLTVTVGGHRLVRRSDLDAFKKLRALR